jgi:hypothetical protein
MARYNTVISSASAATTASFTSPGSGAFTKLTGSSYTVTIGDPVLFSGQAQTFYNAASGTITLSFTSVGAGIFVGPGASGSTSQTLPTGTTITVYSDGTNWVTLGAGGGPINATTGTFSSQLSTTGSTGFNIVSSSTDDSTSNTTGAATFAGGVAVNKNITIGSTGNTGKLRLVGSTSGTVTFQAAATTTGGTYTFPAADGTSGYALTTNGGGTLAWSAVTPAVSTTVSASTFYPALSSSTSGSLTTAYVVSSGLSFVPSTGTLTVTAITESSSRALKMNINPINNALDAILKLKGVTYDRKDGSTQNEAGLIAEQVNKILPNLVSKDAKGKPTGIHYTKLTAYLIEAVKSLQSEIDELSKQLKKSNKGTK